MSQTIQEDDFLIQKKTTILTVVFVTMCITGSIVSLYEYLINPFSKNSVIQILGTIFILISTADLFIRKNIQQSAIIFTVFSLSFLTIRYVNYSSYMAPSVLWLAALAPGITWVTGRKFGLYTLFAVLLSITLINAHFYLQLKITPTRPDGIFIISSIVVTSFLTYVTSQTQELYYHHLEEKINIQKKEIHQGQLASLGELAGNIAHEINNPLQIIKGNSSRLYRKIDQLKIVQEEENKLLANRLQGYAENIDRTVDKTKSIVESLLKLSRKGEDDVNLTNTSLTEIWNQSYPLLESKLRQSKASISFFNMEKKFIAQPEYLAQILINLISNSLFEIEKQESPWIRIEYKNYHIDIVDSGEGFSEEAKNKIMTPFYTTKGNEGTGLGLPLCSALMKQMGGELIIPTKQDNTTIRLQLPAQE